jgi:hypothetical protein
MVDLITLDEYKSARGLNNAKDDPILQALITDVSDIIEIYLDRKITQSGPIEEVISLDYDTPDIYLENYPIMGPVTVTGIDPSYYDSTVHFPIQETTYIVDYAKGRLIRIGGKCPRWPQGQNAITVNYTAGANNPQDVEVPAALKRAAMDLVTYYKDEEYKPSKSMMGTSTTNAVVGTGSTGYSTKFPPHIQRVLDLFK